ncbi:MAG: Gfo/Idh/MocA family protein [Rhizobiaceae bacterium]
MKWCGTNVVYDLATPPDAIADTLNALPEGAADLVQMPMGSNLADARRIRSIVDDRKIRAAVNFQLRFSPMMLAAADIIRRGLIGKLLEIDVQVNIFTPWHLFPFLGVMERVEISVHSIHYLDMIRALAGNPKGVFCRTMGDPRSTDYAQTRTSAILDYGSDLRVIMNINHNYRGGNKHQVARFRIEGSDGCLLVKLGVLYNYPKGEPDEVLYCPNGGDWESLELIGSWFPDAFIGTKSSVLRFDSGEDSHLVSGAVDAFETMALVEACYEANSLNGVKPDLS